MTSSQSTKVHVDVRAVENALLEDAAALTRRQQAINIVKMGTAASFGDMDPATQNRVMQAFNMGSQFGLLLPYSRSHESEADYMGLIYAARACFDPREAPKLWERMSQAAGGNAAPASARVRAMRRPTPWPAPVTRARRPVRSMVTAISRAPRRRGG